MRPHTPNPGRFGASFLFDVPFGPRVYLDNPENLGREIVTQMKTFVTHADANFTEISGKLKEVGTKSEQVDARLVDIEQKLARRGGSGGPVEVKSWGHRFTASDEYKATEGRRGGNIARAGSIVANSELEHKNLTSVAGSGAALIPVDRRVDNPILLPFPRLTVRDLVAPGTTESNAVTYPRMTGRTNNAASVAEGALKPMSDLTFEEVTSVVRTLAHFFYVSRQVFDDAPALAATIDAEARNGLAAVEDGQLLFGSNAGTDLQGIATIAPAFAKQFTTPGPTQLDVLLQAIAQVEALDYAVDGLVMNAVDWRVLQGIKDGQGRYMANSPFEPSVAQRIWNTPTVATTRMPRGKFLIGNFRGGAQIFDRMGVEVVASTEDRDNFVKNMVTLRAEERLAFTVQRPNAFVYGDFAAGISAISAQ